MEFLTRLLFESLPWLLVAEVIALAVVVAIHRRRYTPGTRRAVWITMALCVGLIALQHLVVTDREAIDATIRSVATAVDRGEIDQVAAATDETFTFRGMTKAEFIDSVDRTLQRWSVDEARIGGLVVQVSGDRATASFRATCDLRSAGGQAQNSLPSVWRVQLVRRESGWKLAEINEGKIGPGVLFNQGGLDVLSEIR